MSKIALMVLMLTMFARLKVCTAGVAVRDYSEVLEELTYPTSEWRPDDFGRDVPEQLKELLVANKPQHFTTKSSCGPVDFHNDYLPLFDIVTGNKTSKASRSQLKRLERTLGSKLKIRKPADCVQSENPPLYAYAWTEQMPDLSGNLSEIKVLKYSFAFFKSGLPAASSIIESFEGVIGDPKLWHYLDIHGAMFYLLDSKNDPFALVLAQHDYFRSYVIGKDITREESKKICFAKYSNEPYICSAQTKKAPTASGPEYMSWILGATDVRPLYAGNDLVPGYKSGLEVFSELKFLPSRDPMITSWIHLGPDIKTLFGLSLDSRNAPPGMAIFNAPSLKEIWKTGMYFYFDPGDFLTLDKHVEIFKTYPKIKPQPVIDVNGKRFLKSIEQAKRN